MPGVLPPPQPISPLAIPPAAASVLLFGGTFDPPHRGHIDLTARARDAALGPAACLVFIPAARSPLKSAAVASDADRLQMLRLAIRSLPNVAIWTDELDRPPPSYTIDTVRRARQRIGPGPVLRLLVGADAAAQFHRWLDFRDLRREAPPLVLLRDPYPDRASLAQALRATAAWSDAEIGEWLSSVAEVPPVRSSSTDIRARGGAGDLDPAVAEYIRRRGLYGPAPAAPPGPGAEKKPTA